MIYLNNSGTSWPKPTKVNHAIEQFSNIDPDEWESIYQQGQNTVQRFFNIPNADRFIFTNGCTSSLKIAFSDFDWSPGDKLIISNMEHHALSRWFHKLQIERGVEGIVIPRDDHGPIDLQSLEEALKTGARMVAVTMASNVTGEILPYKEILQLSRQYHATCLLDGAQTAGIIPIDISDLDPDIFVFAGHKGPLGPQGIGGLYIKEGTPFKCPSAACEVNHQVRVQGLFPSYCDTGSLNMLALAGLSAGFEWIEQKGWATIIEHRNNLVSRLINGLNGIVNLEILGHTNIEHRTGAVGIKLTELPPEDVADQLWNDHKIKCGVGFQCAPMAHEALGTEINGCIRISVGPFNESNEIDKILNALVEILGKETLL